MAGILLNTNISSLQTQRQLGETTAKLQESYKRLSSGLRINRASDDAAGLAIATELTTNTRIKTQALRNVNDGISLLNIAQDATQELQNIAIRQGELAEQAANGVCTLPQRLAINQESDSLVDEFNRIVATTSFNGMDLLDRSNSPISIQAGMSDTADISAAPGDELGRTAGTGTLDPSWVSGVTSNVCDIALGDFNGDNNLDLVTISNPGTIMIGTALTFFGDGTGNFSAPVTSGILPYSIGASAGDINGDNVPELASWTASGTGTRILAVESDGSINGNGVGDVALGFVTVAVKLVDVNQDSKLDIIGVGGSALSVALGNGDGTFKTAVGMSSLGAPKDVALADFNGDGILDAALSDYNNSRVLIMLGNGDGRFHFGSAATAGTNPYGIETGDFNRDGRADIVCSNSTSGDISVLLGDGAGGISATSTISAPGSTRKVLTGDLNNDGITDLLAGGGSGTKIFLGNGDGSFVAASSNVGNIYGMKTGDLNSDGVLDLAIGYRILSNSRAAVELGHTQVVNTIPKFDLLSQSGALAALTVINGVRDRISSSLGAMGATMSRLSVAANQVAAEQLNEETAASRITDADIADESATLVKRQILQQAAVSVLAQANQAPQIAISLLRNTGR